MDLDDVLAEVSVQDIISHFDDAGDINELIKVLDRDAIKEVLNLKDVDE